MPEPLMIYECPECGSRDVDRTRCESLPDHDRRRAAVRVFREEDVRKLWEGAVARVGMSGVPLDPLQDVVDAFPAPEEWTA